MFGFSSRKAPPPAARPHTVGLALTASHAVAVGGMPGATDPRLPVIALDDTPDSSLPLLVRLDKKPLEVGLVAQSVTRSHPHLVCANFLPQLGQARHWLAGRAQVTPEDALKVALAHVAERLGLGGEHVALALPGYLSAAQVETVRELAKQAKLPVCGTVSAALAVVAHRAAALLAPPPANLAEDGGRPDWVVPIRPPAAGPASVVVVGCDDYGLTATFVAVEPGEARVVAQAAWPKLALKLWKDRLLDSLADRCVRVCRRDPRDSASAEQGLYDQLDAALERVRAGQGVSLTVRAERWYQDLMHQPEEFEAYCAPQARAAAEAMAELVRSAGWPVPPRAVWLGHVAARMPGLAAALRHGMPESTDVAALPPHAAAEAAAALAPRWVSGRLPRTHAALHLDTPAPDAAQSPPARGWAAQRTPG